MELIGEQKVLLLDSRPDSVALAREIASAKTSNNSDEAFVLVTLDSILDRYSLWKRELPMIQPFYAVKCNTDKVLIRVLAALGAGFDCASKEEIDIVLETGVSPDRVIYANPCKTRSFVSHAQSRDVTMMTFDNKEELVKVQQLHPDAEMILRIAVSDPTATCPLNLKFGAEPVKDAPMLLKAAQKLGVNVVGISFHVGSGCNDPDAYRTAISHAKDLCEFGKGCGFDMKIIDMGGGFPGSKHHTSFESIADVIRRALDEFFPDTSKMRLIAEPGRFFAAAPASLITNVIHYTQVPASRITKNAEDQRDGFMYYINDGVYGSFNCILFDHVQPTGRPLFDDDEKEEELFPTTIWGPTCDSLDRVEENTMMRKLTSGDWILYENMGAYTSAASTTFNGFARPNPIYVISADGWQRISSSIHI